MKTIIIYDTKSGITEKFSHWIKNGINDHVDVKKVSEINSLDYDLIVIGSPTYFGNPMKSILTFLQDNQEQLANKKIALFLVHLLKDRIKIGNSELENGESVLQKLISRIPDDPVATELFLGELKIDSLDPKSKLIINRIIDMANIKVHDIKTTNKETCVKFGKYLSTLN